MDVWMYLSLSHKTDEHIYSNIAYQKTHRHILFLAITHAVATSGKNLNINS